MLIKSNLSCELNVTRNIDRYCQLARQSPAHRAAPSAPIKGSFGSTRYNGDPDTSRRQTDSALKTSFNSVTRNTPRTVIQSGADRLRIDSCDLGTCSVRNQRARPKGAALYRHFRSDPVSAERAAFDLPPNCAVTQRELIPVVWKLVDLDDRGGTDRRWGRTDLAQWPPRNGGFGLRFRDKRCGRCWFDLVAGRFCVDRRCSGEAVVATQALALGKHLETINEITFRLVAKPG